MSVEKNYHAVSYDGYNDAYHGELYFNTYGGVDGFCNDNEDGL